MHYRDLDDEEKLKLLQINNQDIELYFCRKSHEGDGVPMYFCKKKQSNVLKDWILNHYHQIQFFEICATEVPKVNLLIVS